MSNANTPVERDWTLRDVGAGLSVLLGLALSGYGGYTHLTVAARVSAGQCDGCAPWHPLFVVAPIVVGVGLVLLGGYVLSRR
ncbi:hypothetical protein EGH21_04250 [Halomicroarcula sp. F13]|uniref:Disulfide bond formation protein B n=1 Tax=Haloarcula rubra TaxID=2487747 RepID=A0AAW4PPC7_9EURY|nr:hypothetical protein [Halomicroarcula rubra]MBX0322242.1 hypothetical protein [Halomicroarcula rubra]